MARLGPFEHRPAVAVGVSGGADSLALSLLLEDWLKPRGGQLLALIVDHRLRPDSTDEAASVAARLAELGIEARILTREGATPQSGVQEAARLARYALLEQAAAAAGFLHLALAHHAQDQRETVALRLAGGSGPRGLAGMAAIRELAQVRVIRPLLATEPAALRALLRARRVDWLEDPSNRDARFWRARYRSTDARDGEVDAPAGILAASRARRSQDRCIADFMARHAGPSFLGFIDVARRPLETAGDELLAALLGRLIVAVGGTPWPPGQAKLQRLADWLRQGVGRARTVGGVSVERGPAMVRFLREPRAVARPLALPPGSTLWDGRFRVDVTSADQPLQVAMAGSGWRRRLSELPTTELQVAQERVPAKALQTLPLVGAADQPPIALGPWRIGIAGCRLAVRFRPRARLADLPFC